MLTRRLPRPGALLLTALVGLLALAGLATAQSAFPAIAVHSSTVQTVTVQVAQAGTAGSVAVLTGGAVAADFTLVGDSCSGAYSAGQFCMAQVAFQPSRAGQILGAVQLISSSGALMGTTFIGGTGQAPLAAYSGESAQTFTSPTAAGLALDHAGNIFEVSGGSLHILQHGTFTDTTAPGLALGPAQGLAFDGAGNLYIAELGNQNVVRIPSVNGVLQYSSAQVIGGNGQNQHDIAVDAQGNVFISSGGGPLFEIHAGSLTENQIATVPGNTQGLVFGNDGSLYVTVFGSGQIYRVENPESATPNPVLAASPGGNPMGLGVDPAGDLVYDDASTGNIYRILNTGGTLNFAAPQLVGNMADGRAIAFDSTGLMYVVSDGGSVHLSVFNLAVPPSQSYPQTNPGAQSAPQSEALTNMGNLDLAIGSVAFDAQFPNQGSTCLAGNLAPGSTCNLTTAFAPAAAGNPVSGTLTIQTNAFNETGTQAISQSGVAPQLPQNITFANPGNQTLTGAPIALGASASSGLPISYAILGGSTGVGTVVGGSLEVTAVGSFTISASQAGNATYAPAATVTQTFNVSGLPQTISFPALTTPVIVNNTQALAASASSGLPVVYTITAGAASISGASAIFTNAGSVTITASAAAGGNYTAATPVSQTIQVNPEPISYTPPTTNVGQSAAVHVAFVNFSAAGTLNAINVVTQGAPNLDFTAAGGNCVVGRAYTAGQACEVDYTFSPKSAGTREGGIVLLDANSNALGTSYLSGLGNGPLGLFSSPVATLTANSNISVPRGISVDGNGNVFFANTGDNILKEIPAGSTTVQNVLATPISTGATAVDGAGNLYLASQAQNAIFQVVNGQLVLVATGVNPDDNLEIDGAGNLYTSDYNTGAIYQIDAGTHHVHTLLAGNQGHRFIGMHVDPAGNIFAADFSHNILYELPAGASSLVALASGAPLNQPHAVAVDPAGNVYVGNLNGTFMMRYAAGTWQETNLPANGTKSIVVDGTGNIYAAVNDSSISVYSRNTSPTIAFPSTPYGQSATAPAVEFENDGNADLVISSYAASANFGTAGAGNTCASGTLASGATCFIAPTITPVAVGPLTGALTLVDNNLNQVNAQQVVNLTGSGTPAPLAITASDATMSYGSTPPAITASASGLVNGDTVASLSGLTCSTTATSASNVGTYPSSCSGAADPNYTITYTGGTVTITKVPASITWSPAAGSITYGTTLAGVLNASGTNAITYTHGAATVNASTVLPAGSYTLTATIAGDQNHDSATANFGLTVTPAAATVTASSGTMVYGTTPPAITPSASGLVNGDTLASFTGLTCSTTATSTSDVNTYPSTCSGAVNSNYTVAYTAGTVTITKAASSVLWSPNSGVRIYGSSLADVLNATGTGAVAYTNGASPVDASTVLPAGNYTLTATSAGDINHTGSSAQFALIVAPAPLTVTASSRTMVYGTTPPPIAASITGLENGDTPASLTGLACSTTATSTSDVGTYPSTCSGAVNSNYTVFYTAGTVRVTKATSTVTWSPNAGSLVYGTPLTDVLNATGVGALSYKNGASPVTAATVLPAGNYTLTATSAGDNNHTGASARFALAVTPAPATVTASSATMVYGTTPPTITGSASGLVNGDTLASLSGLACSTAATSTSDAGTYPSTCAGAVNSNYTITYTDGAVTITKAASNVTWAPPAASIVYGTPLAGVLNAAGTGAITYTSGAAAVTGATVLPAGSYTLTATSAGDNDHTGSSATVPLTVAPAPLTVTAASLSRSYNTANPVFTGTLTGAQNGDSIAVSYSTAATQASNVGTYAIVPALSGTALVNYTITSVNGVLTIVPAAQAITFTPIGDQVFNGTTQTITLNAAASSGLPVAFTVTGPATVAGNLLTINAPGAVTVTALQPGNGNYLAAPPATQTFNAKLGFAYLFYATSSACNSLAVQGNVTIDSFDSSLGAFPAGLLQSDGNIGTNGSLQLGGNASIYGALFDPHGNTRDGDCDRGHQASLIARGRNVQLTGGIVALPALLTYPTPAAPSVAPPTSDQHLNASCGSLAGCSQIARGHLALAPGQYGNLVLDGNVTVDLSAGVYNVNSLRLNGNAKLNVASGPVVINLAGAGQHDDAFDATGGTIQNAGNPGNLVILYAGQLDIELGGNAGHGDDRCDGDHDRDDRNCGPNAGISAIVDAPNADVKLSGNAIFSGTIIGSTISVAGDVTLHYDRSLATVPAIGGGTAPAASVDADHDGHGDYNANDDRKGDHRHA